MNLSRPGLLLVALLSFPLPASFAAAGPAEQATGLILSAPLEGQPDAAGPKGVITANVSEVRFVAAPIGQAALLMRYGYDHRTVLSYGPVEDLFSPSFTASCRFAPNWDGNDPALHGILSAKGDECSWNLFKDEAGMLVFAVARGDAQAAVKANVSSWKHGQAFHLAAVSDAQQGRLILFIDAKEATSVSTDLLKGMPPKAGALTVGNVTQSDVYSKTQAEGVLNAVRIFNRPLTAADCAMEMARKENPPAEQKQVELPLLPPNAAELKLWELAGAYCENSPYRRKICLNALWRCQLTESGAMPAKEDWKYLAVPGRYAGFENSNSENSFQFRDADFNKIPVQMDAKIAANMDRAHANPWNGKLGHDFANAWYERAFAADPSWKDRSIILRLDELSPSESGEAYLNGRLLSKIDRKFDRIDIDPASLRYDAPNFLTIHTLDAGGRWDWRGIKGDVWLLIEPKVQLIEEPKIETSFRRKELSVSVPVRNLGASPLSLHILVRVEGDRAPSDTLQSPPLTVAPGERAELSAAIPWPNPRLWDLDDPYLYNCRISLVAGDAQEIDNLPPERFGFKEFWIDKADFLLNGLPVRLRTDDWWYGRSSDPVWALKWVATLKKLGYNALRAPFIYDQQDFDCDQIIQACDEGGLMVFVDAGGVRGNYSATWNSPDTRRRVETTLEGIVKPWWNHPSIMMWYLSTNFLGYGWDYHPLEIANGYLPQSPAMRRKFAACQEGADMLLKLDSTRPYFFQAGGNYGPVLTCNGYFGWWPLAEQMEWPEEWSKTRPKPLFMIETSFPYIRDWLGMDGGRGRQTPYMLPEQGARCLGYDAYRLLAAKDLELLDCPSAKPIETEIIAAERAGVAVERKVKDLLLGQDLKYWRGYGLSAFSPFAEASYAFYRKSTGKSYFDEYVIENASPAEFRTPGWHADQYRVPAQCDADADRPFQPTWDVLHAGLKPLLAYVGGDEASPTALDHSWYAGDAVEKTIVVANDQRQPLSAAISWHVADPEGKTVVAGATTQLKLEVGQIVRIPVKFAAPGQSAPQTYKLCVESDNPDLKDIEPFDFKTFPAQPESKVKSALAVYDPEGVTTESLRKLGAAFKPSSSLDSLDGITLLIVGRNALDAGFAKEAARLKLSEAVEQGRVNVVVFEQKSLAPVGLLTNDTYSRDVFAAPGSSLMAGLSDKDLSWPRGDGTLAPSHQPPAPATESDVSLSRTPLWHWSNRNLACSYPIRRPSASGCAADLLTGVDMDYAPLLEVAAGKGRITFCQYELSGRVGADPASAQLLERILEVSSQPLKKDFRKLQLLSSDARAEQLLAQINLPFEKPDCIESCAPDAILLADLHGPALQKAMPAAEAKAAEGATVIFLPLSREDIASIGLRPVALQKVSRYTLTREGASPLAGLDDRDRFFHYSFDAVGIEGGDLQPLADPQIAAVRKIGKGKIVYVQLDPAFYDDRLAETERQLGNESSELWILGTLKERMLAVYAQLLANAGAEPSSEMASRLASPVGSVALDLRGQWKCTGSLDLKGADAQWASPNFPDSQWKSIAVPGYWEDQGVAQAGAEKVGDNYGGGVWYRKTVQLPQELQGKELYFSAPKGISDYDWVYVDGVEIGRTGRNTPGYWQAPRFYRIPPELTRGKDSITLAAQVFIARRGRGGISSPVVALVLKSPNASMFPYWAMRLPSYDTEKHIRW